jgi:transposase-like protein
MDARRFQRLLCVVAELSERQRAALIRVLRGVGEGAEAIAIAESRRPADAPCPHCSHERVQPWGHSNGLQRWRCKSCRKTFNALTGTPLAGLRKREVWLEHGRALADGVSLRKVAERCDVALSTAFRWRHRHLKAPSEVQAPVLAGIVEADETYFLKSAKGSRKLIGRLARTRGGTASTPGLSEEHLPVLIARDRHGATVAAPLFDRSQSSLAYHLEPVLTRDALLVSDGAKAYGALARRLGLGHVGLNISAGEHVRDGIYHVQNVNSWASGLKGWMRRFKGVATKNMSTYLGWRRIIEAHGVALSERTFVAAAVGQALP